MGPSRGCCGTSGENSGFKTDMFLSTDDYRKPSRTTAVRTLVTMPKNRADRKRRISNSGMPTARGFTGGFLRNQPSPFPGSSAVETVSRQCRHIVEPITLNRFSEGWALSRYAQYQTIINPLGVCGRIATSFREMPQTSTSTLPTIRINCGIICGVNKFFLKQNYLKSIV